MTAKEALREIIEGWTEEEAATLFPFLTGRSWDEQAGAGSPQLSARDLLRLPPALRSVIIRHTVAQLTQEELEQSAIEAEAWIHSDADALTHIDD